MPWTRTTGARAGLSGQVHVHTVSDGEAQDVRARLGPSRRAPDNPAPSRLEALRRAPNRLRRPTRMQRVRSEDVEPYGRFAVEAEADDRPVPEPVAVRRDRRQQPVVPGEGQRPVRHLQAVQIAPGEERGQSERDKVHRLTARIGTPSRLATNGTVDPWTTTEKSTTTKTISYKRRASCTSARITKAASRMGTAP